MSASPAKRKSASARYKFYAAEFVSNGHNKMQAAISAGYSPKTAKQAAMRIHAVPVVIEMVEKLEREMLERAGLTADETMARLANIIRFDPRKMFHENGDLKDITELDDNTASALAGFEVVEHRLGGRKLKHKKGDPVDNLSVEYTKKVKWHDKNAALANAMRHFKLLGAERDAANINIGIVFMPSEFANFG